MLTQVGKTNERDSWQYDPKVTFNCTIGNQFEILMLIESLELNGIDVISANTDGILCYFKKELEDEYNRVCQEWEITVGNDKMGKLEYTNYKLFVQTSVNDYIAVDDKDDVKLKGDFLNWHDLHKNKSSKIIPIALKNYFVNNILPEDTIKNHDNIFDFCIGKKATRDFYYQGVDKSTGNTNLYDKVIRYYLSTKGEKLLKIKKEGVDSKAPKKSECESSCDYQTVFNKSTIYNCMKEYDINYEEYINRTYQIISKISPEVGKKRFNEQNGILTLF